MTFASCVHALVQIARIDVDDLVRNVDVEVLQEYLENICFADVTMEDASTFTDEAFIKLFRLTQLIIECASLLFLR